MTQPSDRPTIGALAEAIVASYDAEARTRHIDAGVLPDLRLAAELMRTLRDLVFPGYFTDRPLLGDGVYDHAARLIGDVREMLDQLNEQALAYEWARRDGEADGTDGDSPAAAARRATDRFLEQLTDLRDRLALDVQATYDGDPAAKHIDETIYCYPSVYAVFTYRVAHALHRLDVPLLPRVLTEQVHHITGIDIHPGAQIGRSFFIDHGTGVVIGETTIIGDRVKLYQGVTLGALSFPKDERGRLIRGTKRHPTLEDDVIVYANATILGGQTVIGTGSVVGASAFITRSVPPGHMVTFKSPELKIRSTGEPANTNTPSNRDP